MSRFALLPALALVFVGCAPPGGEQPKEDPPTVRSAECRWAIGPIVIDGRTDEKAWENAQDMTAFSTFWDKKSGQTATSAKLLWDADNLYFSADMEDYDLYADITERNGMTWLNDVFELFFKPATNRAAYYEFQVSANNTGLELFLPSRGAGGYMRFAKLSKLGMKSAVKRRGTLNKVDDKDGGWTVEGAIPWSGFDATGGRPKPGAVWKFTLCRYDYSWTLEQPELTSSAPLTRSDFHRYEDYGDLHFVGK